MTIGNRILELLEERNMSQRELAEKVGVTEGSMSRYINGSREPKADVFLKIAKGLLVPCMERMRWKNDRRKNI